MILDEVFHLHSLRTQLEVLCTKQQVQVQWIEVRCSYDVVERRLRLTKRDGHILSTEEALKMHLLFQEIFEGFSPESQNHIVVNNDDGINVDLLVESVLKKN